MLNKGNIIAFVDLAGFTHAYCHDEYHVQGSGGHEVHSMPIMCSHRGIVNRLFRGKYPFLVSGYSVGTW